MADGLFGLGALENVMEGHEDQAGKEDEHRGADRLPLLPVKGGLRPAEQGLDGEVIATDGPFGNLVTNISGEDFLKLGYARGQSVHVTLGTNEMDIPFVRTFSDVPLRTPLLYIDSRGHLGLALNQASFAATYGVKPPVPIYFPRAKQ